MDAARNVFDNFNYRIFCSLRYSNCNKPDSFRKLLRIREYGWVLGFVAKRKGGWCCHPPSADF